MAEQLFNFNLNSGGGGGSTPGGNQFMGMMPAMAPNNTPGIVPPANNTNSFTSSGSRFDKPTAESANSQYFAGSPLNPNFTKDFFGWLQSQIGQGATPFNLSAVMPSDGSVTQPGQLSAPNNQLIQALMKSFQSGPMADMLATGSPVDQTPAWQAMVDSMQKNIGENRANLKESFNAGGTLVGSPYGTAAADFEGQTAKDLNAQLLQGQTTALENAQGRKLAAAGQEEQFSQYLQSLDQGSIDRMLQEFIRTRPEYSPLLNSMFGAATTFPPYLNKTSGGGIGGQLPGMLAGGAGAGIAAGAGGGGASEIIAAILMGMCWIAELLYGVNDPRTDLVRRFLCSRRTIGYRAFTFLYRRYGKRTANLLRRHSILQPLFRFIFNLILADARRTFTKELKYAWMG